MKEGQSRRESPEQHKINMNLLKERIELERRLIQEKKERLSSRKGDAMSSD